MGMIVFIVLTALLLGALPRWFHSADWGYYPAGGVGMVRLIHLDAIGQDIDRCRCGAFRL